MYRSNAQTLISQLKLDLEILSFFELFDKTKYLIKKMNQKELTISSRDAPKENLNIRLSDGIIRHDFIQLCSTHQCEQFISFMNLPFSMCNGISVTQDMTFEDFLQSFPDNKYYSHHIYHKMNDSLMVKHDSSLIKL